MYKLFFITILLNLSVIFSQELAYNNEEKKVYNLGEYEVISKNISSDKENENKFSDDIFFNKPDGSKYMPELSVKSIDDIHSFHEFSTITSEDNELKMSISSKADYSFSGKYCFNTTENDMNRIKFSLLNDDGHREHSQRKEKNLSVYSAHYLKNNSVIALDINSYKNNIELPFPVFDETNYYSLKNSSMNADITYLDENNNSTGISYLMRKKDINGVIWSDIDSYNIDLDHKRNFRFSGKEIISDISFSNEKINTDSFDSTVFSSKASVETDYKFKKDILVTPVLDIGVSSDKGSYIAPSIILKKTLAKDLLVLETGKKVQYHKFSDVYFNNDNIDASKYDNLSSTKTYYIKAGIENNNEKNSVSFFVGRANVYDMLYIQEKIVGETALQPGSKNKASITTIELNGKYKINRLFDVSLKLKRNITSENIPYFSPLDISSELAYNFSNRPATIKLVSKYIGKRYFKENINLKLKEFISHDIIGEYKFRNDLRAWAKVSNIFGRKNYKRYNYSMPLSRFYIGLEWIF